MGGVLAIAGISGRGEGGRERGRGRVGEIGLGLTVEGRVRTFAELLCEIATARMQDCHEKWTESPWTGGVTANGKGKWWAEPTLRERPSARCESGDGGAAGGIDRRGGASGRFGPVLVW